MTTETLSLADLLLACAGATVPCPAEHNLGVSSSRCKACRLWECDPAGRVYFFPDSVRLPCPSVMPYDFHANPNNGHVDPVCQGRSWVPNRDGYAWREALRELQQVICIVALRSGDRVSIWPVGVEAGSRVDEMEGLWDHHAEMTAIYRMVRQIPDLVMGT